MENFLRFIFIIINWSGIIGGVWLLCLGEWKLILYGLFFLWLSKYIISALGFIPLIPALLLAKFGSKNKLLMPLLMPICIIGHPLGVAVYGTLVVHLFYYRYFGQIPTDPLWLLVLGLGTSPWQWFASKEKDANAYATAFVTELVFFLMSFVLILFQPNLSFVFLMLFIGQLVYSLATLWEQRKVKKKATRTRKISN